MRVIPELYARRAQHYDFTSNLYYLMGVPVQGYRRRTVAALELRPGSHVVDLACGTGANFPWLEKTVGEEGRIIGVDLTPAMLAKARERISIMGWKNIELVQTDAAQFSFPSRVDGVLCTYALTLMPEYPKVVRNAAAALQEGGRFAILDLKYASNSFRFLNGIAVPLTKPFGGTEELFRRRPWEEMRKWLSDVQLTELYLGFLYIAVGTKAANPT
jgi:ubiquinone/menaquinone biosynthesis C-methylase UbiE